MLKSRDRTKEVSVMEMEGWSQVVMKKGKQSKSQRIRVRQKNCSGLE